MSDTPLPFTYNELAEYAFACRQLLWEIHGMAQEEFLNPDAGTWSIFVMLEDAAVLDLEFCERFQALDEKRKATRRLRQSPNTRGEG